MKKIFFLITLFVISIATSFGQVSTGGYVVFPDKKLSGSAYKPRLAFNIYDGNLLLTLCCTNRDDYATFDGTCRLLIKFEGDDVIKLPISDIIEPWKDYDNEVILSTLVHFYSTYSSYEISQEDIDKIVIENKPITKIRIVFSNGEYSDYDILKNYQKELSVQLAESYHKVQELNKERVKNIVSDDNF